jgi:hypothetical protein
VSAVASKLHPAVLYTAGRFACFLVAGAVLYALNFRSWFLVIGALVLSAPLSYFLLKGVRSAWSAQIEERLAKRRAAKEHLRATLRGDDEAAEDKPKNSKDKS